MFAYERQYVLETYNNNRLDEHFQSISKKSEDNESEYYVKWINDIFKQSNNNDNNNPFINNLFEDLKDGELFIRLVEIIENITLKRKKTSKFKKNLNRKKLFRILSADNVQICINHFNKNARIYGLPFDTIKACEITSGNKKIILGFLFLIKRYYDFYYFNNNNDNNNSSNRSSYNFNSQIINANNNKDKKPITVAHSNTEPESIADIGFFESDNHSTASSASLSNSDSNTNSDCEIDCDNLSRKCTKLPLFSDFSINKKPQEILFENNQHIIRTKNKNSLQQLNLKPSYDAEFEVSSEKDDLIINIENFNLNSVEFNFNNDDVKTILSDTVVSTEDTQTSQITLHIETEDIKENEQIEIKSETEELEEEPSSSSDSNFCEGKTTDDSEHSITSDVHLSDNDEDLNIEYEVSTKALVEKFEQLIEKNKQEDNFKSIRELLDYYESNVYDIIQNYELENYLYYEKDKIFESIHYFSNKQLETIIESDESIVRNQIEFESNINKLDEALEDEVDVLNDDLIVEERPVQVKVEIEPIEEYVKVNEVILVENTKILQKEKSLKANIKEEEKLNKDSIHSVNIQSSQTAENLVSTKANIPKSTKKTQKKKLSGDLNQIETNIEIKTNPCIPLTKSPKLLHKKTKKIELIDKKSKPHRSYHSTMLLISLTFLTCFTGILLFDSINNTFSESNIVTFFYKFLAIFHS